MYVVPNRRAFGDNRGMPGRLLPGFLVLAALATGAWNPMARALDSRPLRADGVDYRVVTLDLAHERLELHWRDADAEAFASIDGLREWGEARGRSLLFATNAGIYDQQSRPLGLYIEGGKTLRGLNTSRGTAGSGNFSIQPNGVFYVDTQNHADVVSTGNWREHPINARLASQSGPMLVINGAINPHFDAQSDSLKWRSGVCAKTPQQVIFAVSEAPVTFHAFAKLFRDELGCQDALYLDGTLSQIYTKADGTFGAPAIMVKPYAAMFAVFSAAPPVAPGGKAMRIRGR
jgi:uncharacterized protein YigE (DUF2233 family)